MKKFDFRGTPVEVTSSRITDRESTLYYYEVRHADGNVNAPRTIEPKVMVNFAGTVVAKTPLDLGEESYIELDKKERSHLAQLI